MQRTLIRDLDKHIGETVKIQCFVQILRKQKTMQFLVLRDRTGMAQAINEKKGDATDQAIDGLTLESSVEVVGEVVKNPQVKLRNLEIIIKEIKVLNLSDAPWPIDEKSGLDARSNWRVLDLRERKNLLVFKVQTLAEQAMREFWYQHEFIEIHSPKLMGSASESGAELFRLEYFDRFAYLAQSPQFYKQMAIAAGFEGVFEIGPVFRANPSFTSRHDTEFTSVDTELAYVESHFDVMKFEEEWIHHTIKVIKEKLGDEIKEVCGVEVTVPALPFPKITMAEAHEILAKLNHKLKPDDDLDTEGERLLCQAIKEKTGHDFVFVYDYPSKVRPFYHMRYDDNKNVTKSFDLLWNGLEVTSGAQREHRYDILVKQAEEKGLALEPIQDYLNCFRYGCPPHGGFGFGLSRMLMLLLGFKNVREVTFLYRGPNRLSP